MNKLKQVHDIFNVLQFSFHSNHAFISIFDCEFNIQNFTFTSQSVRP